MKEFRTFEINQNLKMQLPKIKETAVSNQLKKNYLSYIDGPILFTAPHSKKLNRGGKMYDQKIRIHLRQIYASYLAGYLAKQTRFSKKQYNSFCVWGKSAGIDEKDLDPNYLIKDNMHKSPFHQTLHKWAQHHINKAKDPLSMTPLLHVDIHGKMDRPNNCQIQVGLRCMEVHWDGDPLIGQLQQYFDKQFPKIFDGIIFGKFQCKMNCDCTLHGYWGDGIYTMNQQSIMMGIPSFQFQIPRKVRQSLFKNSELLNKFGGEIRQIYQKIITPWWKKMEASRKLSINKQLGLKAETTVKYDQVDDVIRQLEAMDKKAQLLLNVKFI